MEYRQNTSANTASYEIESIEPTSAEEAGNSVHTSSGQTPLVHNALSMLPHASPPLDFHDELLGAYPEIVAMSDWVMEQTSGIKHLAGTDPITQNNEENTWEQFIGFEGERSAAEIGTLPSRALEPTHVGEPVLAAEQRSIAHDNAVINELHSLLEQAPEQRDEVLIASGAGRDSSSDRSAHVPSPAANDIAWLPTAGFYSYYCPPLTTAEARPPSTTSTDSLSADEVRSELSNQDHLSIAAALHHHTSRPQSHQHDQAANPQPLHEASLGVPPPSDVPLVDSVETHEPRTSEPHYIIDVSPPAIRLHQPDPEQARGMSPAMTAEASYPSPTSEAPAGSPVTMAVSEQMMMDKHMSPAPVEVARPKLAIKRDRDAPRNATGQLYCDHPDCSNQIPTFRRPCEWNKHMDKHDRPYKCQDPDCDKLAGFTYSGGLLRHQREVHKMHAPERRLMCPFPNCNRSSGKGFTRQENLKEHIRRLHKTNSAPTPESPSVQHDVFATGHSPGLPSPTTRAGKRRRLSTESSRTSEDDIHNLREEVVRLRRESREKDTRLAELEKVVSELRQKIDSTS